MNTRNQFGRMRRNTRYKCDACELLAVARIDVARSWFPAEDQVLLLCAMHAEQAHGGEWRRLDEAIKLRQASNDRQIRENTKNES